MSPLRQSLVASLVIALALGAAAIAWRLAPPPAPPPGAALEPIFDVPASAVRAIDVDTWQGRLRARREGGHWRVEEIRLGQGTSPADPGAQPPAQADVDQALDALVSELVATPQIDRFDAAGLPMRDFGLDPPRAAVVLALDDGAQRTLQIGELTVTTAALYARVLPSPDVFQIGSLVFNDIGAAFFRLRALAGGAVAPSAGDGA